MIHVPNLTLLVIADTNERVCKGSKIILFSSGSLPSSVAGYGVCGLIGHNSLSNTHRESSFSSSAYTCDVLYIFFICHASHLWQCNTDFHDGIIFILCIKHMAKLLDVI